MQMLMKPEEAAVALGVSRAKCYALIADGVLPSVLVGRARRVPVAALEAWIAGQITESSGEKENDA